MMRYEESCDFTTTLHRRLLYILNETFPVLLGIVLQ